MSVSACLSAFILSHPSLPPSHNPKSDDGGGNVDFSGVGIGSEQRASRERAKIATQSLHNDVGPRLREHEIIELRATLLFSERRETHSSFRRILQRGEIEFAARAHCLFESGGSSKVHT